MRRPSLWSGLSLRSRLILIATVPQLLYTNVMTWLGDRTQRVALANLTLELADHPQAVRLLYQIYGGDERQLYVGVSLVLGAIAAGVAALYADGIRARISMLGNAATRIAGGDLATPVGVSGSSEIGRLGSTLEQVRARLGERIELERQARSLEKDLALASTVDRMLLPSQNRIESAEFAIAASHRGAASCSGDFWTYHLELDGSAWLLIGDVSGTGAGPAMMAAAVVTSFRTAVRLGGLADIPSLLSRMHETVLCTAGDRHPTALTLVELTQLGKTRLWSAGGRPLLVLRKEGSIETVGRDTPCLGASGKRDLRALEIDLGHGDLALCFTGGLLSASLRGHSGQQALEDMLLACAGKTPLELCDALERALPDDSPAALKEDVTFAALARTPRESP